MNTTKPRVELVRAIEAYVRVRRGEMPLRDELRYIGESRQQPTFVEVEHGSYFGPPQFDPQHSGGFGSEWPERHETALTGCAVAALVCSVILSWATAVAVLGAVARWVR